MHYLLIIFYLITGYVWAAPVSTPLNPIVDLTQDAVQQSKTQTQAVSEDTKQQLPISMTSQELLQQPQMLSSALDTAVSQQNITNIRFLLPLYQQLQTRDSVLEQFAQAILYRADNDYVQAQAIFKKLLQKHPDFAPIRLQYALTLSQDNQLNEAQNELDILKKTKTLPKHIEVYIAQFEQYMQHERKWQFNGNLYYFSDKNVNDAPKQREYGFWHFDEPKSANGLGYEFSAQKTQPLKGHWAARINVSAYGKLFWDAHSYDDLIARAEMGLVWHNHRNEIAAIPYYEQRWFGAKPYSNTVGNALRYTRNLSPNTQLFVAWQLGYKNYNDRKHLEGATNMGSLSLLYRTSPQQYFVLGAGGGYEAARDDSDAYSHAHLRASINRKWQSLNDLDTSLSVTIQQRRYKAEDLFNIKRKDMEYVTRVTLSHPKLSWRNFTPRLNWIWSKIHSNHFYYQQIENKVFIDVSKQF